MAPSQDQNEGENDKPPSESRWRVAAVFLSVPTIFIGMIMLVLSFLHNIFFVNCWKGNAVPCVLEDLSNIILCSGQLLYSWSAATRRGGAHGFDVFCWWMKVCPWPSPYNTKLTALGKARVRNFAEVPNEETLVQRKARFYGRKFRSLFKNASPTFVISAKVIEELLENNGDINFPDESGNPALFSAVEHGQDCSVRLLLDHQADANSVNAQSTALHLCVDLLAVGRSNERILSMLVDARADLNTRDTQGLTPYMKASASTLARMLFIPVPPWEEIVRLIKYTPVDMRLQSLSNAVDDDWTRLRIADYLFCTVGAEVSTAPKLEATELEMRQRFFYDCILEPVILEVCSVRSLTPCEKKLWRHLWAQSGGKHPPPKLKNESEAEYFRSRIASDGRVMYRDDLSSLLARSMTSYARRFLPIRQKMMTLPNGRDLIMLPACSGVEYPSCEFGVGTPWFAVSRSIKLCIHELFRVRAIASEDEWSDLLQGRSRFWDGQRVLFEKVESDEFWLGMVSLWLLAIYTPFAAQLDDTMKRIPYFGSMYQVAPTRHFDSIMARSKEHIKRQNLQTWGQKVKAPLLVCDILRGTFEVPTPRDDLRLGRILEFDYRILCSRNGHNDSFIPSGEFRSREWCLVFLPPEADVEIIVRIRVVQSVYADAKMLMGDVYPIFRGEYDYPEIIHAVQWKREMARNSCTVSVASSRS